MLNYILCNTTISIKGTTEYDNWGIPVSSSAVAYPCVLRENNSTSPILSDKGEELIINIVASINGKPCINTGDIAVIGVEEKPIQKVSFTKDLSGKVIFTKLFI